MQPRRTYRAGGLALVAILYLILAVPSPAADGTKTPPTSADKEYIIDGRVVHDVGLLQNNATNWGMIGSAPTYPSPMSDAPSGRWPGADGTDYLWSAGLWVGAIYNGEPRVSRGGFRSVLMPGDAPGDTIYQTAHGALGGNRFPWPAADDDGDGLDDEDPLNGLDDDGDSLIDEDFAAIGEQHFTCVYRDDTPQAQELYPDHNPLGISVVQSSYQWSDPGLTNTIGYEFTITNVGDQILEDVYVGMFSDFDIRTPNSNAADLWDGIIHGPDGGYYPIYIAYMLEVEWGDPQPGLQGWLLLDHTTDPTGESAPHFPGVHSYRDIIGSLSYEDGGDPTNDAEEYDALSCGEWDNHSSSLGDHRVLISSGPFTRLTPRQSVTYQVALVAGEDLDDLLANAVAISACYYGRGFEDDGQTRRVNWISPYTEIVPASFGSLLSEAVSGGLRLTVETNVTVSDGLVLKRQASSILPERTWTGDDLTVCAYAGNRITYEVLDEDAGPSARTYDLLRRDGDTEILLDRLETRLPAAARLALQTSPNPFNPQTTVSLNLPADASVQVQVFDAAGRLVRTLHDGRLAAGDHSLVWNGRSDDGRVLPSGVYLVRAGDGATVAQKKVTLAK